MRCSANNVSSHIALTLLCVGVLLTGCARAPWTDRIDGDQKRSVEQAFLDSAGSQSRCGPGWNSELGVTWNGPVKTYSVSADCQMLEPSYLKVVATTPLGFPLMVVSTDGTTYQRLDASQKLSITGSLRSWAVRNDIPPALVENSWFNWLMGRSTAAESQIAEVRLDGKARGAWLSISRAGNDGFIEEYILFDRVNARILERMIVDELDKVRTVIAYHRWQQAGDCRRPVEISISGLPYGASADLLFSNIQEAQLVPEHFNLTVPPSFQTIMMP